MVWIIGGVCWGVEKLQIVAIWVHLYFNLWSWKTHFDFLSLGLVWALAPEKCKRIRVRSPENGTQRDPDKRGPKWEQIKTLSTGAEPHFKITVDNTADDDQ
jgi:hypothetical protein